MATLLSIEGIHKTFEAGTVDEHLGRKSSRG